MLKRGGVIPVFNSNTSNGEVNTTGDSDYLLRQETTTGDR